MNKCDCSELILINLIKPCPVDCGWVGGWIKIELDLFVHPALNKMTAGFASIVTRKRGKLMDVDVN